MEAMLTRALNGLGRFQRKSISVLSLVLKRPGPRFRRVPMQYVHAFSYRRRRLTDPFYQDIEY